MVSRSPLEGIVTVEIVKPNGQVFRHTQPNLICNVAFDLIQDGSNGYYRRLFDENLFIFLSSNSTPASRAVSNLGGVPTALAVSPTVTYTVNTTSDPWFIEYFYSFPATGSQRIVNTIGLAANPFLQANTAVYAYLVLDTPCIQEATDFLNVIYRIQPVYGNSTGNGLQSFNNLDQRNFFLNQAIPSGINVYTRHVLMPFYCAYPDANTLGKYRFLTNIAPRPPFSLGIAGCTSSFSVQTGNGYTYKRCIYSWGQTNGAGWQHGFYGWGNAHSNSCPYALIRQPETVRLQGRYRHRSSAPGPFFQPTTEPNGTGVVDWSGNYSGNIPMMYQVEITSTGSNTSAQYRVRRHGHVGYSGNSWHSLSAIVPFLSPDVQTLTNQHGRQSLPTILTNGANNTIGPNIFRVSDEQVCCWDATGITLINLFSGDTYSRDANTAPALPVSNVCQVECDGLVRGLYDTTTAQFIYLACRATGLWRVSVVTGAVTQLNPDPCYGVDVGSAGKVWAVFGSNPGRLANSDDYTASVPFNFVGISDNNWTRVSYIHVDPDSSASQLAIVRSDTNSVVWWSSANANAIAGPTFATPGQVIGRPTRFNVSDVGGEWASTDFSFNTWQLARLVFGTQTYTGISDLANHYAAFIGDGCVGINNDTFINLPGGDGLLVDNLSNGSNQVARCQVRKLSANAVQQFFYAPFEFRQYCIYLGRSLYLRFIRLDPAFSYAGGFLIGSIMDNTHNGTNWDTLGWDGTQWVSGHPGTKVCHSSPQAIVDGLSVAFVGTGSGTFVATDYYNLGAGPGLLKDNTTELSLTVEAFVKRPYFDQPLPSGLGVPTAAPYELYLPPSPNGGNANPHFISALTHNMGYFNLGLDGVQGLPVTTAPSPGQVQILGDRFVFNAADAGKPVTGTYGYITH